MSGGKIITDPRAALLEVGKENTEMREELNGCYQELDRYRRALTTISTMPYSPAAEMATRALANRPLNG